MDSVSRRDSTEPSGVRPASSRRTFLRGLAASLAVAVPAFGILTKPAPARAAGDCEGFGSAMVCEQVYVVYEGHFCGRKDYCPNPPGSNSCVGIYNTYCTCSGQFCGQFLDVECTSCCNGS